MFAFAARDSECLYLINTPCRIQMPLEACKGQKKQKSFRPGHLLTPRPKVYVVSLLLRRDNVITTLI